MSKMTAIKNIQLAAVFTASFISFGSIAYSATLVENAAAITNAAAQIDAAIVAKGGATAGGLNNAAAAIAALPSGGGGGWVKPADWPDLKQIVDSYPAPEGFPLKVGILCNNMFTNIKSGITYPLLNNTRYRSSYAPDEIKAYSSTSGVAPIGDGRYGWVVIYLKESVADYGMEVFAHDSNYNRAGSFLWVYSPSDVLIDVNGRFAMFFQRLEAQRLRAFNYRCNLCGLKSVKVHTMGSGSYTDVNNMFSQCWDLKEIDVDNWELDNVVNFSQMFANTPITTDPGFPVRGNIANMFQACKSLTNIVERSWDSVTSAYNAFYFCNGLTYISNDMCLTNANNISGMFQVERSVIRNAPTNMQAKVSFNLFVGTTLWTDAFERDTFAKFVDGELQPGCFVSNLNEVSGLTVTVNSEIKKLFTTAEQTAIGNALTAKGWTLAW